MEHTFGSVDYQSEEIPFTFTDYYSPEMGPGLRRVFLSIARLVDPSRLAQLKRYSDEVERWFCRPEVSISEAEHLKEKAVESTSEPRRSTSGPRRRVNLDPGLLTLGRLILASTKDNAHRIPLSDGIYAEVTLLYRKGDFESLHWTYPDYRSEAYHRILRELRRRYKEQLREEPGAL